MTEFDKKAQETLEKLSSCFNVQPIILPSIQVPFTVGIEIEVKFKYYFPELYQKYFKDNKWKTFSYDEQCSISKEIEVLEKSLQDDLDKTKECGVPKGNDKYWEFSFDPVNDLSLLIKQVDILQKANLIPPGRHSLHITIGGPSWYATKETRPLVFYVLMILELLFSDKERIEEGFASDGISNASWAKKGMGGIMAKNEYELIDDIIGYEFRSLILKDDTNLQNLFEMIKFVMLDSKGLEIIDAIKSKMLEIGLPDENWKRPSIKPEIWRLYIEKFDYLSNELNKILS